MIERGYIIFERDSISYFSNKTQEEIFIGLYPIHHVQSLHIDDLKNNVLSLIVKDRSVAKR